MDRSIRALLGTYRDLPSRSRDLLGRLYKEGSI